MSELREQLEAAEQAFHAAMISNDPARIAQCITLDWVLVTPERGPIPGQEILALIGAGVLTHQTMTKTISDVQVLGSVATVTAPRDTRLYGAHCCRNDAPPAAPWLATTDLEDARTAVQAIQAGQIARRGFIIRRFPVNDRITMLTLYPLANR